ncbi:response regulator transcription factor [Siphonobacter sp. SORGH_AS_0500]|uniref:DNA-binding response regulator n=1 Tax=Siphonobacter sp. SORGH_AS_0500 TaxID=1864824 RepID=UPI00285F5B0E|nr:response regulator transcription factor [Siphonobacter sp. SORGH_AS_0500]MDR6197288.1 DNA-binding NarL/FixJ family response regulator [Siphonobacter sp. SORGH_AS_0500]
MNQIQIILVEPHPVTRAGIKGILTSVDGFFKVREINNILTLDSSSIGDRNQLFLVIIDPECLSISLPEAIERLKCYYSDLRIIVYSSISDNSNREIVLSYLRCDIMGLICKSSSIKYLMFGIKEVYNGMSYLSPEIVNNLLNLHNEGERKMVEIWNGLSSMERKIVKMTLGGYTIKSIASELNTNVSTVYYKVKTIQKKGNFENKKDLICSCKKVV